MIGDPLFCYVYFMYLVDKGLLCRMQWAAQVNHSKEKPTMSSNCSYTTIFRDKLDTVVVFFFFQKSATPQLH